MYPFAISERAGLWSFSEYVYLLQQSKRYYIFWKFNFSSKKQLVKMRHRSIWDFLKDDNLKIHLRKKWWFCCLENFLNQSTNCVWMRWTQVSLTIDSNALNIWATHVLFKINVRYYSLLRAPMFALSFCFCIYFPEELNHVKSSRLMNLVLWKK